MLPGTRSKALSRTLGQQLDAESVIMPEVDGAHLRLAGKHGARVARVPDVTMLGFRVPGEELQEGVPLWRNAMAFAGLPHSIIVNRDGKRFGDESFYRSIYSAVDVIDGPIIVPSMRHALLSSRGQAAGRWQDAKALGRMGYFGVSSRLCQIRTAQKDILSGNDDLLSL